MRVKQLLKNWWKAIIVLGTPILLVPLLIFFHNDASRCGYVILILVIYWITEAIPVPVTSLLPLILFPMAGVLKASQVAPDYFRDMMSLFFGSVTLAYAIQNVNLHRRVALFVLTLVGSSVKWMMAGLMVTTWLLSMWINNAACTSIMLPVALAIADECAQCSENLIEDIESPEETMNIDEQQTDIPRSKVDDLKKGLILCVSYSTIYGGLATIVGSAVTIFLKGYVDEQYKGTNFQLTFFNYLLVALPASALMLVLCWVWLQIRYGLAHWPACSNRSTNEVNEHLKRTLKRQYNELGHLRWNELIVTGLFFIAVILWITRDLDKKHDGWSVLFRSEYVSNGTVALLIGVLTMILPNDKPFTKNWTYKPIVDWTDLSRNFPWGTMILLGSGLSIAHAAKVSKLLDIFGNALKFIHNAPPLVILIVVIIISELFTQLISNLSIASILFPIISPMARTTGIHPAYLIIPCTLALSQSFLLPISSQPNAIVFSTGFLRSRDLITTGIVMNIVGGLIVFMAATTWMIPIFNLNQSFNTNSTFTNSTLDNTIAFSEGKY